MVWESREKPCTGVREEVRKSTARGPHGSCFVAIQTCTVLEWRPERDSRPAMAAGHRTEPGGALSKSPSSRRQLCPHRRGLPDEEHPVGQANRFRSVLREIRLQPA